ncbi:MAG: NAD(P)/FAD-dependent oxidoreductase [Oscillospiraceae bacterium]
MSITVSGISVPIDTDFYYLYKKTLDKIKIKSSDVEQFSIYKYSIDARKQNSIALVYSLFMTLTNEKLEDSLVEKNNFVSKKNNDKINITYGTKKISKRPIIVGFGPAGMFCALLLAQNGYNPIILERGEDVDNRVKSVDEFWINGVLNSESNVQFGEGGAGTFSDGKLTTRINDPLCYYVLNELVNFGADENILVKSKPHIGTDKLRGIVKNIRNEIINLGGEIRFSSTVEGFGIKNQTLQSVTVRGEKIESEAFVFAIGHSARDTFNEIIDAGIKTIIKPFSVGVRIEHLQMDLNKSLYGKHYDSKVLGNAEYQLSYRSNDRAVYSFCMCPGGTVVPSASSEKTVVVNGMSEFLRDKSNSNAGLVVSVNEKDFGENPKDAIKFQETLENLAFLKGGSNYNAPCQDVKSFLDGKKDLKLGKIIPSYSVGIEKADFNEIFSKDIVKMLHLGINNFGKKIKGFDNSDVILTGVETRTSSPIRIVRGEDGQSVSTKNFYPCGEGAGYAGGIMSAAVDGMKIAIKIMSEYSPI